MMQRGPSRPFASNGSAGLERCAKGRTTAGFVSIMMSLDHRALGFAGMACPMLAEGVGFKLGVKDVPHPHPAQRVPFHDGDKGRNCGSPRVARRGAIHRAPTNFCG